MSKKVKLRSSDLELLEVDIDVIKMSSMIKKMLEDSDITKVEGGCKIIPLPHFTAAILKKVINWCHHHKNDSLLLEDDDNEEEGTDDIPPWDIEFFKVDQSVLLELILAANYLDIEDLHGMACVTVANMIRGKTAEEIRRTFSKKNNFTPQEAQEEKKRVEDARRQLLKMQTGDSSKEEANRRKQQEQQQAAEPKLLEENQKKQRDAEEKLRFASEERQKREQEEQSIRMAEEKQRKEDEEIRIGFEKKTSVATTD